MNNISERMKLNEEVMALIQRRREETGDEFLGSAIEKVIIDSHFRELEQDIFDNPGAFEPWLVKRRKSE